jgi:hypothetical protein
VSIFAIKQKNTTIFALRQNLETGLRRQTFIVCRR